MSGIFYGQKEEIPIIPFIILSRFPILKFFQFFEPGFTTDMGSSKYYESPEWAVQCPCYVESLENKKHFNLLRPSFLTVEPSQLSSDR